MLHTPDFWRMGRVLSGVLWPTRTGLNGARVGLGCVRECASGVVKRALQARLGGESSAPIWIR